MNYQDASSLLSSIRRIPDKSSRLHAAMKIIPPDAVQSACRLSEPSVEATEKTAAVYRFSENGLASCECLADVQYCSCDYFQENVIRNCSSATVHTDCSLMGFIISSSVLTCCTLPFLLRTSLVDTVVALLIRYDIYKCFLIELCRRAH